MQDAPILKSGERGFDNLKPTVLILICGFDLFGHGRYQYTFENSCREIPGLVLGDEVQKIILNTRGTNDEETSRSLIDFLHYVTHTEETTLTGDCDERLKRLHEKMDEIKSSVEVGVMYMKMEERDRLIEERGRKEGWLSGRTEGRSEGENLKLIAQIQKKIFKGKTLEEIADEVEEEPAKIQILYTVVEENRDKTAEEILNLLK